jgi:hypothetical protein
VKTNVSEKHAVSLFRPEDEGSMFLRNVVFYLRIHTPAQPRRTISLSSLGVGTWGQAGDGYEINRWCLIFS